MEFVFLHLLMKHEKVQKNLRRYNHDHHNLSLLVLLTKQKINRIDFLSKINFTIKFVSGVNVIR